MPPIRTTDEHPFWVVDADDFLPAGELEPGDRFQGPNGELQTLAATRAEEHPEGVTVYNFEVENAHTYFVLPGEQTSLHGPPVLVHNAVGKNCFPFNPKNFKPKGLMRVKGANGKYTWREFKGLDAKGKPIYGKKLYEYHPGHEHDPASGLPRNLLREKPHYHRNTPSGPNNRDINHHVPPPGGGDSHLPPESPMF